MDRSIALSTPGLDQMLVPKRSEVVIRVNRTHKKDPFGAHSTALLACPATLQRLFPRMFLFRNQE